MSMTLNQRELQMLEEARQKVGEDTQKRKEKKAAKLWATTDVPMSLSTGLSRMTKVELNTIAKNFGLKRINQLKKQELIDELLVQIPEKIKEIILCFDLPRYELTKKVVQNQGYIHDFRLYEKQIEYLQTRGLLFPGTVDNKRTLIMPEEIVHGLGQMDDHMIMPLISKNTEWTRLTQGLLYYYGTLTINEIQEMLENYTDEKIDQHELVSMLEDVMDYYGYIREDQDGYSYYKVLDSKQVKEQHQRRTEFGFYPLSKEQLIQAGEPEFVDRTDSFKDLVEFIVNHADFNREAADQLVKECMYATNVGEHLHNIVGFMVNKLELNDLELLDQLVAKIVAMMNNSRHWILKGYTPYELAPKKHKDTKKGDVFNFATKQKIGRNDPCPCGSGKKYKKCCAN